jgi:LPS export ABC transporter protein LptC
MWQKWARVVVALFIVAFAGLVYTSIGRRREPAPATPVERIDPSANLEVASCDNVRLSGITEAFNITCESWLSYPDGSLKLVRVRISVRNRGGRDYVITAGEAKTGPNQQGYELHQTVVLTASDGFELQTEDATYNQTDSTFRAPGAVTFARGRMRGSGVGMSYDQPKDLLTIAEQASVTMLGEDEMVMMAFEAGSSVLDRLQNTLVMDGGVHVVRSQEEFDADRAAARLSEQEEFVTFVELRGNARVAGGNAIDAMSARDIDLDYTDDGKLLEHLVMIGDAVVALKSAAGKSGRQISGGTLDLALAPDGTITKATGRDGVQLTLPPAAGLPGRTITARTLDGEGKAGVGLTSADFRGGGTDKDAVEFRETGAGASERSARAQALHVELDGDAVSDAAFTGRVTFRDTSRERRLEATAADVRYAPAKGTLRLTGMDAGGRPHVADDRISIDAGEIDLAFETHKMTAKGLGNEVRTVLSAQGGAKRPAGEPASKMPRLLKADQPVSISAAALDYGGPDSLVVYTGGVILRQGDDSVRAQRLELDQKEGNLLASGGTKTSFTDESGTSEGTADETRYTDAKRLIVHSALPPAVARLKGPDGDLKARTITISLKPDGPGVARLEARTLASIGIGRMTITGAYLLYDAATGDYEMTGATGRPVTFVEAGDCQQSQGMKFTYSKTTKSFMMDSAQRKTSTLGGAPGCKSSAPAPTR